MCGVSPHCTVVKSISMLRGVAPIVHTGGPGCSSEGRQFASSTAPVFHAYLPKYTYEVLGLQLASMLTSALNNAPNTLVSRSEADIILKTAVFLVPLSSGPAWMPLLPLA